MIEGLVSVVNFCVKFVSLHLLMFLGGVPLLTHTLSLCYILDETPHKAYFAIEISLATLLLDLSDLENFVIVVKTMKMSRISF
jgi:hypothetical protein